MATWCFKSVSEFKKKHFIRITTLGGTKYKQHSSACCFFLWIVFHFFIFPPSFVSHYVKFVSKPYDQVPHHMFSFEYSDIMFICMALFNKQIKQSQLFYQKMLRSTLFLNKTKLNKFEIKFGRISNKENNPQKLKKLE